MAERYRCALCGRDAAWEVSCCGRPAVPVGEDGAFADGCPIPCSTCEDAEEEKERCAIRKRRRGIRRFACRVCGAEYESIAGDETCPVCGPYGEPEGLPD